MDIRENKNYRLYLRKIPWPHWIMGVLFVAGFVFSLYVVHEELIDIHFDKGLGRNELISVALMIFLLVMGLLFIYSGKVRTMIFDKRSDAIIIYKTRVTCARKMKVYRLSDLKRVRAAERGYERGQVNTLHYVIVLTFTNGFELATLDTSNSQRARKELLLIKKFMGFDLDDLVIKDETTKFHDD